MRIKRLALENIGPFIEADLDLTDAENVASQVVLITGENGTGKSIILDAIRGMFGKYFATLERDIRRRKVEEQAKISLVLEREQRDAKFTSREFSKDCCILSKPDILRTLSQVQREETAPNWIVDYWPSALASGTYQVNTMVAPKHEQFLVGALQGQKKKEDITQLICHLDYLRDSQDPDERATGERLYGMLEGIIADSLLDGGYLSHVARATYDPIVMQNGQPVPLANLSGGNSYLIQNMVGLLGKMYSLHFLNQTPLSELGQTPGLLLIDEAENQLHPKWQKRLIGNILKVFPNLQIVATTHSPFIVASMPNVQLFVCKARVDHCVVEDETGAYGNKPVDEILMSPLFEATRPFNAEITALLERRDAAIKEGDGEERAAIERQLYELNPAYFAYFEIDQLLDDLSQGQEAT
jgi:predicted ATP-binding protein involved in virulence